MQMLPWVLGYEKRNGDSRRGGKKKCAFTVKSPLFSFAKVGRARQRL
jgi:hypothetical protein